jgi:glyoxylase-like metal-dependent hydrolase (beta-lactamase superfamily II)
MNNNSFRFKIGNWDGLAVNDGSLIVPPPPSEKPGTKGETMDVLSLMVDTGKQRVLIDTGCGDKFQATTGKLVKNLNEAGVRCQDIDIIIFTHGHIDHAAGAFSKAGKPVFPAARYIVAQKEWQCWVDKKERPELRELFMFARQDLVPIPEQFQLAADGQEVITGIVVTTAPGHTPGSSVIKISSQGQTLTCIGDLIHSATEFEQPDYYAFLDTDPVQAIKSRSEVLSGLAESGEMAFVCHFPFPGLGHMVKNGQRLGWKPI